MIAFNETYCYLRVNKPGEVSLEEIESTCNNYSRLCSLIDSVFNLLHSKRGEATEDKIEVLKYDLNLARIKWQEMNLSYVPKFHLLYEYVPEILLQMNGFYDMGKDDI